MMNVKASFDSENMRITDFGPTFTNGNPFWSSDYSRASIIGNGISTATGPTYRTSAQSDIGDLKKVMQQKRPLN